MIKALRVKTIVFVLTVIVSSVLTVQAQCTLSNRQTIENQLLKGEMRLDSVLLLLECKPIAHMFIVPDLHFLKSVKFWFNNDDTTDIVASCYMRLSKTAKYNKFQYWNLSELYAEYLYKIEFIVTPKMSKEEIEDLNARNIIRKTMNDDSTVARAFFRLCNCFPQGEKADKK